jgi:hypothetical protein
VRFWAFLGKVSSGVVFFSDGSSNTPQKAFYKKNPKPIFSQFFLSRFWAFLGEGSSKTRQKMSKK